MSKIFKKFYQKSPQEWVAALKRRLLYIPTAASAKFIGKHAKSTIDRKTGNPLAAILSPKYFAARDPMIVSNIVRILNGERLEGVLSGFNARDWDDLVIE